MRTGQKKLSEVARHICAPGGIVSTGWPAVASRLKQFRIPFDLWQEGAGRLLLAKRENGKYAASVGGAVFSIARQVGKTYFVGWIVFALCTLFPGLTAIWTAHHTRTSNETFSKMQAMARRHSVAGFVESVRVANGEQAVFFKNGSRILFGARDQGFGLGFDKVDILVLDEGQRLKESTMNDMVPATNAAPNGLVVIMGTPPRPTDAGEVFAARREDALEGDPETLYIELSADADAKVIDWEQVKKANPSYPERTSREAILRMQKLLGSDENFMREAYGIWDVTRRAAVFGEGVWEEGARDSRPAGLEVGALGVAVAVDAAHSAIVAGARDGDDAWVKVLAHGPGMGWAIEEVRALREEFGVPVAIDGRGPGAVLIPMLERESIDVDALTTPMVLNACANFDQLVREGRLLHESQPELDAAVSGAQRRKVGDRWAWGRKESEDISCLEAATLAAWAAESFDPEPVSAYEDESASVMML